MLAEELSGKFGNINVTPLIDVLLVLLVIFMIIMPVTPRGENAPDPAAAAARRQTAAE